MSSLTVLLHGEPRATQQVRLGVALLRRGHRVVVCDAPDVAAQIRQQTGAPIRELRAHVPPIPARAMRFWVRRRVRALGVDLVHVNFVEPWHRLWSMMDGAPPYVVTAWGSDLNDEVRHKTRTQVRWIDHVLQHAAAITADSHPLLEKAVHRSGERSVPAELVLWGVDLQAFGPERARAAAAEWRRRLDIAPEQPVVLSPRQTRPPYHVDRILRAFAASRWARDGLFLVKLYGRPNDEEDRARLEALAEALGVRPKVRFAPACSYAELPGLLATANVAVSALEVDGFPSTFCELLALGVPLVATDLPAYGGLLLEGEQALLVPPNDHNRLVDVLDRLADEPALAARLRANGIAWARATAGWEGCVDKFEAIYRAVLIGPAPRES